MFLRSWTVRNATGYAIAVPAFALVMVIAIMSQPWWAKVTAVFPAFGLAMSLMMLAMIGIAGRPVALLDQVMDAAADRRRADPQWQQQKLQWRYALWLLVMTAGSVGLLFDLFFVRAWALVALPLEVTVVYCAYWQLRKTRGKLQELRRN